MLTRDRFCIIATIAVLLMLLQTTSVFAQNEPPTARPGFVLESTTLGPANIPALLLFKEGSDTTPRPAVIFVHGGAVVDAVMTPGLPYKEEWFRPVYEETPYALAEAGMLVVAIDAAWAESRITDIAREAVAQNVIKAILSYWMDAVADITNTIDYLLTRDDVDPKCIGAAGKSGGAMTLLMASCVEPRLAAVVSWKGGADLTEFVGLRGQTKMLNAAFEEDPAFKERLTNADAINHPDKIPPIALINNQDDPAVPRACAEALHEKLVPLYAEHPDRLMLKLIPTKKPTHDDQIEAFEAGVAWLKQHLLSEAATPPASPAGAD